MRASTTRRSSQVSLSFKTFQHWRHMQSIDTLQCKVINIMKVDARSTLLRGLRNFLEQELRGCGRIFKHVNDNDIRPEIQRTSFNYHPKRILNGLLNNSQELHKAFNAQRLYFMHVMDGLGKCYVTLNTYNSFDYKKFERALFINVELCPVGSKTRMYKLLINSVDLLEHFKIKMESYIQDFERGIMRIVRPLLSSLRYKRQFLYCHFVLPSSITNDPRHQVKEFKNVFKGDENEFMNKSSCDRFLENHYRESVVIYQVVRRLQKNYVIFTIEKHILLKRWCVRIYVPKYSRQFVFFLFPSDLLNFEYEFLERMLPRPITKLLSHAPTDKSIESYQKFLEVYNELIREGRASGRNKNKTNVFFKMMVLETIKVMHHDSKNSDLPKIGKLLSIEFLNNFEDSANKSRLYQWCEIKFWDNLVKIMDLHSISKSRALIKVNTYKCVLRELFFKGNILLDRLGESNIEIMFEDIKNSLDLFAAMEPIVYSMTANYNLHVRIQSLSNLQVQQDSINLREIINLYISDGLYRFQTNYLNSKLNLSNLIDMSSYVMFKIKTSNLIGVSSETKALSKKNMRGRATLIVDQEELFETRPNMNLGPREINQHKGPMLHVGKVKDQDFWEDAPPTVDNSCKLLYKGVLSSSPKQIITLFYREPKDQVISYVYRLHNSTVFMKKYTIKELEDRVEYLRPLLKARLYAKAGERIMERIRRLLSIYSYFDNLASGNTELQKKEPYVYYSQTRLLFCCVCMRVRNQHQLNDHLC
eukprot:TRINITY_DN4549_c0_g1_i4.p1 TRINITY_DN4549_c0_g1~~TRINITY_DN4549_c0_g1_i4.p1  ORF type:complete len:759 (+),score=171.58 TRINITY_DN4549_c0_g1_i4:131-2407(+)